MFTLPDLPYSYEALEPFIDSETMHIHHDKHHATYVKNLNDVLVGHEELLKMDVNEILSDLNKIPEDIKTKVKNNGGGVANHSLFWEVMGPEGQKEPSGKLMDAIKKTFGDFPTFKEKFSAAGIGHFGSGWAWLVVGKEGLEIVDTANQDSPVSEGKIPILLLDVWEHAYYLKYKNMRADYIAAWWNIVNWKKVEELFEGGEEK